MNIDHINETWIKKMLKEIFEIYLNIRNISKFVVSLFLTIYNNIM